MIEFIVDILKIFVAIYFLYVLFAYNNKRKRSSINTSDTFIRSNVLPYYIQLEKSNNAKYPCLMYHPVCGDFNLAHPEGRPNFYFYINDSHFIINNSLDNSIVFEIPFDNILFHDCGSWNFDYGVEYYFTISFKHLDQVEELYFNMPVYNRKLDNKYPLLKNYILMYNFISKNFISKEKYSCTN